MIAVSVDNPTARAEAEPTTFEAAFARYYPRVHQILNGLLGPDEADDAAQETFLRLYHSRLIEQASRDVGPWLYRVAVNLAYNQLRSRRRQAARLERAGQLGWADAQQRQHELNPAQAAAANEQAQLVRAALDHLNETQRALLILRQAGLSYAEVAAATGVKPSSVGTLLARAELQLRQQYLRLTGDQQPEGRSAMGEHE